MLVNWYKLDGNGEDSCGLGPVSEGGSYATFEDETVSNNARRINLTSMSGDFTITADIYRRNKIADWCVDMSLVSFGWGTSDGGTGICIWYHPSSGKLIVKLGTSQKTVPSIIKRWYTIQVSRDGNDLRCYIDGELVHSATYKLAVPTQVHFFNGGSHKTGGGYVKNVMVYDQATIYNYYNLFSNSATAYGIRKQGDE